MTITAEQVRQELETLIAEFPGNTGATLPLDLSDKNCVYYLDADGNPVSFHGESEEELEEVNASWTLKTPVCIVGHWVEKFHPELKEIDAVKTVLLRNSTPRSMVNYYGYEEIISDEALTVLDRYQMAQDSASCENWSKIPNYLDRLVN